VRTTRILCVASGVVTASALSAPPSRVVCCDGPGGDLRLALAGPGRAQDLISLRRRTCRPDAAAECPAPGPNAPTSLSACELCVRPAEKSAAQPHQLPLSARLRQRAGGDRRSAGSGRISPTIQAQDRPPTIGGAAGHLDQLPSASMIIDIRATLRKRYRRKTLAHALVSQITMDNVDIGDCRVMLRQPGAFDEPFDGCGVFPPLEGGCPPGEKSQPPPRAVANRDIAIEPTCVHWTSGPP